MKILINEHLSEHRYKTPEGYLICTDAILARTGKQTYRKNEIFKDSDDETEIEVDRTEDEVFSPQTLASFENKPVTVEHPDEDVNVHNYKEYAVGFVRDVRRGEANGQPVILGNLVITDEQTIQEIEDGEHTDLSCGYDCDIVDEANPCQRNIRGNHVALCECGRAGIARIVDSTCDANHLPAKVKRDLQKFLNHKSTFIHNKDYDISEFVKEFERVSRLWAEFPVKVVRESIKGWFKTGDGMMRKDYTFSIEGYDDRFMVSLYAKPDTYETTELNAYFTDSIKDALYAVKAKYENVVLEWYVRANSEREAFDKVKRQPGHNFDTFVSAKIVKERAGMRIIDESPVYDALIPPTEESIYKFESLLRALNIKVDRKGLTTFGRVHYQVRAFMTFDQFVKKLDLIDDEMNKLGIPMTFSANTDNDEVCTAGIDLDKQYVKDSQRAQKIQRSLRS